MTQTINYSPTFLVTTFYQPKSCQLFKAGDFAYPRAHPGRHWQPATSSSPVTLPFPATLPHGRVTAGTIGAGPHPGDFVIFQKIQDFDENIPGSE